MQTWCQQLSPPSCQKRSQSSEAGCLSLATIMSFLFQLESVARKEQYVKCKTDTLMKGLTLVDRRCGLNEMIKRLF